MPPTWEKGSHLPPGNHQALQFKDGHDSVTAPTAKPDLGFSSFMLRVLKCRAHPGMLKCDRWHTGTLDKLVGSHTKLAIYPTLAICCHRVVICASLDTGFKGMQVVTYPTNIKQLSHTD